MHAMFSRTEAALLFGCLGLIAADQIAARIEAESCGRRRQPHRPCVSRHKNKETP